MKFIAIALLSTLSLPALAQSCYVDMIVKNTGRVVRSFSGWGDSTCIEGMKECRKSIRLDYSSNPQYPNGSLDCVRAGGHSPIPAPNPYPSPIPNPYPSPIPSPHNSVDANSLILDIGQSIYSSETQTKIIESLIFNMNSYSLEHLARLCSSASTWQENARCLIDGVRRAPREIEHESTVIRAVGSACVETKTWQDEKTCFSVSLRNNRIPSLSYLGQSCSNMYNSESSARCYRSLFGR